MTLFARYMFRQAFSALLMILLSLTAVVWIALALKQLSVLTSGGAGGILFLKITGLILPDIITFVAPVAVLVAALYTLNKLNQDSELIVMTAAGATLWRFAKPLLLLAGGVSLWVLASNFYVSPWSQRTINDLFNSLKGDLISQLLQPGNFANPEDGLTFHIRERDGSGHLLGLMLSDTRSKTEQMTYVANSGEVIKQGDKAYLVLHDGKVIRRATGQATAIIEFDSYVLDMATGAQKGAPDWPKPHARYINELMFPDQQDPRYQANPGSYRAELHERFASLAYPFVFIAIAVAFLGQARSNRRSQAGGPVTAFSTAIGFKVAGIASTNLLSSNAWAILLVYGMPAGGLVFALLVAWRGMSPRGPRGPTGGRTALAGRLLRAIAGVFGRVFAPMAAWRRGFGGA